MTHARETCAPATPMGVSQTTRLEVGDVLDGRYQLLRDLGRGGARTVYLARHLFTGRFVAVKMVPPETHAISAGKLHAQLQREGRALASIRHPGVADAFDGGVTLNGAPYVVMEVVEGRTLEGLVAARGILSEANTIGVAIQLCDALEAVHRTGIVHRDVRPANIVVIRDNDGLERIKLVDFGIAQMQDAHNDKFSGFGAVVGTPAYMSPERLLGIEDIDNGCDVYSVGVTMFECLSGTTPYCGNYTQVLLQTAGEAPPASLQSRAPWVEPALAEIVDRTISRNKNARLRSVQALYAALLALPEASPRTTLLGPPPPSRADGQLNEEPQRRRSRRVPYSTPVRLMLPDGAVDARCEDLSEGGSLVVTHGGCDSGQQLDVQIALPMEGDVVAIGAKARWVHDTHDLRAVGLEFTNVPTSALASISRYVEMISERA